MKRKLMVATAAAAMTFGLAGTGVDAAGPPAGAGDGGVPSGVECMQHGLGLLRSLGAPPMVSAMVLPDVEFADVLALHRTDPAAAAGVLESLGLPAGPCAMDD